MIFRAISRSSGILMVVGKLTLSRFYTDLTPGIAYASSSAPCLSEQVGTVPESTTVPPETSTRMCASFKRLSEESCERTSALMSSGLLAPVCVMYPASFSIFASLIPGENCGGEERFQAPRESTCVIHPIDMNHSNLGGIILKEG
jgi:hypothetical protein